MEPFFAMTNVIRDYAWGDERRIPDFLGIEYPAGKPAAEVWMGAHPSAPSRIGSDGREARLDEWIDSRRNEALGPDVAAGFGRLPFLFKLLAAGKSLSIQAHPDKTTAEEGFRREEALGIPRDAPERNYRDDNHKPEIIMAITPFTAMIGFREPADILRDFELLAADGAALPFLEGLSAAAADPGGPGEESGLAEFLTTLLTLEPGEKVKLTKTAVDAAGNPSCPWDELRRVWVPRLEGQFPGDAGVLAPLFLNVVEIAPGEALFQPARMLHAYLNGFGVELMANSDNVLRGGLTPKNVDVSELASVLDFRPSVPEVLPAPRSEPGGLGLYPTPAREFNLALADLGDPSDPPLVLEKGFGPAVVLAMEGSAVLSRDADELALRRGQSAFIPWASGPVTVTGGGRIAVASVPRGNS